MVWLTSSITRRQALSVALVVATLFLLKTPYEGVDALLSAGVDVLFALVAIAILNKSPSAYSVLFTTALPWLAKWRVVLTAAWQRGQIGFFVGASLLVLVLSFQGALFWVRRRGRIGAARAGSSADGLHALLQALRAPDDAAHETAGIVACFLHCAIFSVQAVVTWVVVKSREDVIDTYAGRLCALLFGFDSAAHISALLAAYEYIPDSGFADVSAYSNVRLGATAGYQSNIPTADI